MRVLLLSLGLVAVGLAGCSEAPPTGEFATDRHNLGEFMGTVELAFQERVRNTDDTPAEGSALDDLACPPPGLPNTQADCVNPSTDAFGTFSGLPDPGMQGYRVVLTSSAGNEPIELGALVENMTGNMTYDLPAATFDEDHSQTHDTVHLLAGDLMVASATSADGANTLTLDPMLVAASASAAWTGKTMTVTVSGLLDNVSYTAFLYEDLGAGPVAADSFQLDQGNGAYELQATRNINTYVEFHIHVTNTSINVAQATIA